MWVKVSLTIVCALVDVMFKNASWSIQIFTETYLHTCIFESSRIVVEVNYYTLNGISYVPIYKPLCVWLFILLDI